MGQVYLFLLAFFGIPTFAIIATAISMRNHKFDSMNDSTNYTGSTPCNEAYYRYDHKEY